VKENLARNRRRGRSTRKNCLDKKRDSAARKILLDATQTKTVKNCRQGPWGHVMKRGRPLTRLSGKVKLHDGGSKSTNFLCAVGETLKN